MDLEKYYEIFKNLMPYADKFLSSEHPLHKNIKDIEQIVSIFDKVGGLKNITDFLNLKSKPNNSTNDSVFIRNNQMPLLSTLPKITHLD